MELFRYIFTNRYGKCISEAQFECAKTKRTCDVLLRSFLTFAFFSNDLKTIHHNVRTAKLLNRNQRPLCDLVLRSFLGGLRLCKRRTNNPQSSPKAKLLKPKNTKNQRKSIHVFIPDSELDAKKPGPSSAKQSSASKTH
jgi:hypothetical protein